MSQFVEHDYEPVVGLPEGLPEGEYLRWQGKPDWLDLTTTVFHVRKIALYFAVLIIIRATLQLRDGVALSEAVTSSSAFVALAIVALGVLSLLGWLTARMCRYTITNRRVVIRSGVAVPVTVNLPFSQVTSADYRARRDGCGDIVITMSDSERPSWMILWPFVRPWSMAKVCPMLRALPESEKVAEIVRQALTEFDGNADILESLPRVKTTASSGIETRPEGDSSTTQDFRAATEPGAW